MAGILVPLAQGCEELEAVTLVDLFRRAKLEVITASLDDQPVRASRGTVLIADQALDAVLEHDFDMIVLPGGLPGSDHLRDDPRIQQLITRLHDAGKIVAAICAAPRALAAAGVLEGRRATSYPGTLDRMDIPGMTYLEQAVVVDGNVVTSRGPGTAMDFALTLIELLAGSATRQAVEDPLLRP